jgi:UbiD family decarboxylase
MTTPAVTKDTRVAYKDLREWMAALEAESQLVRVNAQVDWKYELGAVLRKTWDTFGDASPALLFTNIKDYPAPGGCNKLFTGAFRSWYRTAMMMGLDPRTATRNQILRTLKERITNKAGYIPPRWVKTGPVKENILKGDAVNLEMFPTPHWNERDGGRLLGSFGSVFTKDPESGWVNVGVYRLMMHSKDELGIQLDPANQHIGEHYFKCIQANKPMEVAIAIGHDPALSFMACIPTVDQVSELDIAGAIRGEPIDVVQAETVDLPVPANAEIVIEGTIHPKERKMEGPLGEYPGFYGNVPGPKPVVRVKCITHRNDPIFRGTMEGHPVNEDHMTLALGHAAYAWDILERNSIKGVLDVAMPLDACGYAVCVVSIKPLMEAHADIIASALWGSKATVWAYKHVIVVDEDIDPWNTEMVNWSVAWRTRASESIKIWKNHRGSRLDPRIPPEEKGFQDRVLIDATRPYHWAPRPVWSSEPEGRGVPLKFPPTTRPASQTCLNVNQRWSEFQIKPTKEYIGSPEGMMRHWWSDEEIRKVIERKVMP